MKEETRYTIQRLIKYTAAAIVLLAAGGPLGLILVLIYVIVEYL